MFWSYCTEIRAPGLEPSTTCVFTGRLKMLLVSSGFTVLLRILEKQIHFFRVNSPESGLQPSSEELIYRFMEMFETEGISRKFPEWELHPQNRGLAHYSLEGKGKSNA